MRQKKSGILERDDARTGPVKERKKPKRVLAAAVLCSLLAASAAYSDIPPRPGVKWPEGVRERMRTFKLQRSYIQMMQRIQLNRTRLKTGLITMAAAQAAGGTLVAGTKSIPVLLAKFNNTGADPYPAANLQRELFDGPWPTGTMTDYYREVSYNQFTVNGRVYPWVTVSRNDTYYEAGCNGVCTGARTGDFLRETLALQDATVNFAQYDNDGPDGVPNSGDDDGYVDFVAFVHPENGGECGTSNIWSHSYVYSGWTGSEYTTNDARSGGGFIKVDDYVIMPAFACDGTTMIEIGVFAHEFGHAFGLPDLYDTDGSNGDSEGVGSWCLMASGSWGGDTNSPETPTHMCAWAKSFMGWLTPTDVTADLLPATIANVEENPVAFKLTISPTQYFLITNKQRKGFDARLPGAGLLIWHINETVINSGLPTNRVNADENNKGVDLEEADGRNDLDNSTNRGDAGDLFPGTANKRSFDNSTNPNSSGSTAVCRVSDSADPMTADLYASTASCLPVEPELQITLSLDPDKKLGYHETTQVIARVTLGGALQEGKMVTFRSTDTDLASILPPASEVTNSDGRASATVRCETRKDRIVDITATVDGVTKSIPVRVPDLPPAGLVLLMACVILYVLLKRRAALRKG